MEKIINQLHKSYQKSDTIGIEESLFSYRLKQTLRKAGGTIMYLSMYEETHEALIRNYCLSEKKIRYVREPKIAIALIKKDPLRHAVLAFEGDHLVAFLTLYEANGGSSYSTNKHCLLVQDLSTDYRHLRNGYVKQAIQLLPTFVQHHFPTANELMVIVNEDKAFTQALCNDAGFQNTYNDFPTRYGSQVFLKIPIQIPGGNSCNSNY